MSDSSICPYSPIFQISFEDIMPVFAEIVSNGDSFLRSVDHEIQPEISSGDLFINTLDDPTRYERRILRSP